MKSKHIVTLILWILILCGCTQYNGHIGPIFGSWSLVAIKEDGIPLPLEDETVFSFQNELVRVIRLIDPPYKWEQKYGNFSLSEKELTLKFQTKPTSDDNYMYMTPDWLYFPITQPIVLEVRKLNGSEMDLCLNSGGKQIEYCFKKTW